MALTDDEELRSEIVDALDGDPRDLIRLMTAYYRDGDRADRAPRALMYFHLGILAGALSRVLDERTHGKTQTEQAAGDVPPR